MASKFDPRADNNCVDIDIEQLRSKIEKPWFRSERFVCCPWKKFNRPNLLDLGKWKFLETNNSCIPDGEELDSVLEVHKLATAKLKMPPDDRIQVTWIGHATVLVQFDKVCILSDPVFLDYCGPNSITAYKRYRKAPCTIEELLGIVKIDAVIISHNHYDHLEEASVKAIGKSAREDETYRKSPVKWFVAKNQKDWIVKNGINESDVTELDWWEGENNNISLNGQTFKFVCTPTQHWCARLPPVDDYKVLWCGWVVKGPTKSYYFAGDTGYYEDLFKAIGKKYGGFDLAVLPIGAYEPRHITEFQHVDPTEAVEIHLDVNSKQSIGMHWGTFELTNEFFVEPPQKVEEEMKKKKLDPKQFISLSHGETWCVGDERKIPPFMTYKGREGRHSSADQANNYTD